MAGVERDKSVDNSPVGAAAIELPRMSAEPRLAGKVAVITGAAGGIGAQTAALFASHGARVIGVDVNADAGKVTFDALQGRYGEHSVEFAHVDIADRDHVHRYAADVLSRYGRVDVLFNNAGILGPFNVALADSDYEVWDRLLEVNLTGSLTCSIAFKPALIKSGAASVIHNATIDALLGNPHASLYSISKGGLIPMTHVMAWEYGQWGIRVNCIVAGGIPTGLSRGQVATAYQDQLGAAASLRRKGTPLEAAYVALFLASEESAYVSGVSLPVDGGRICLTPGTL
jgi:NAD(P)-dependent dehydrogenase (short-subunit alcohol dehydrogenase family)